MRALFCLFALLCVLNEHALAGTPGISGEWVYYGNQEGTVRINETSGILEDGTNSANYVLREEKGAGLRYAAGKAGSYPGDVRAILRVHEDVLLFLGVKNPILLRKGASFKAPREKIRGRWHYAAQTNDAYYYDAEFDLDARQMVEISRSERGELVRSAGRPLEVLLDAQAEIALQSGGGIYHFTRLGADFLVLEPSYAASARDGYKILMEKMRSQGAPEQAKTKSGAAKESKTKAKKKKQGKKQAGDAALGVPLACCGDVRLAARQGLCYTASIRRPVNGGDQEPPCRIR